MKVNTQLMQTIADCIAACNHCADACLNDDNPKAMANCIRTDLDCAAICGAAFNILARDSRGTETLLQLCVEYCERCAVECEMHETDHCQKCAQACRRCMEACMAEVE